MSDDPTPSTIETVEQLREHYRQPSASLLAKFLSELDQHCVSMINRATFVSVATRSEEGMLDVSPRGDPPGSILVLDKQTLLIPDRTGNNKLDMLTNLLTHPEIALLFLVPGIIETLRVSGTAKIICNDPRLEACSVNEKTPRVGILVTVQKACLQCGKAVIRSGLWEDKYRVQKGELPSFGQMLVDQTGGDRSVAELDAAIQESYDQRLY
ncbi:MSMEG_1061 family FMN-dependent PPOX-type flavoprotein [Lignipirellula cremea]|uniref:Pyridoxamine 5'-phosphate oxidase n=1 Tax=Lignipirellula cremea TaxID=2528010 RepID=A0A518DTN5_9BACT|nr:MSMEG_1061 family FMN-dependent PPOX-type flavoprotein [Lignipirellula cremea]QDU95202.1 Pyridoxamine 5'-phosphate oxidase [Lignipirellula cremea]